MVIKITKKILELKNLIALLCQMTYLVRVLNHFFLEQNYWIPCIYVIHWSILHRPTRCLSLSFCALYSRLCIGHRERGCRHQLWPRLCVRSSMLLIYFPNYVDAVEFNSLYILCNIIIFPSNSKHLTLLQHHIYSPLISITSLACSFSLLLVVYESMIPYARA